MSKKYHAPIICAGDLTNKWNEPPEFINFLLRVLPFMYCVRGNHDTPFHNASEMHKSVYGTLCQTGTIKDIAPRSPLVIGNLMLHGFPHGTEVRPMQKRYDGYFHLAVIHDYIWKRGSEHRQVTVETSVGSWHQKVRGYDAVMFGDNHKGFVAKHPAFPTILNCGTLMRRTTDEIDYQPKVGLINSDGSIVRVALDCSKDTFAEKLKEESEPSADMEKFIEQLLKRVKSNVDFRTKVLDVLGDAEPEVRQLVLESLET